LVDADGVELLDGEVDLVFAELVGEHRVEQHANGDLPEKRRHVERLAGIRVPLEERQPTGDSFVDERDEAAKRGPSEHRLHHEPGSAPLGAVLNGDALTLGRDRASHHLAVVEMIGEQLLDEVGMGQEDHRLAARQVDRPDVAVGVPPVHLNVERVSGERLEAVGRARWEGCVRRRRAHAGSVASLRMVTRPLDPSTRMSAPSGMTADPFPVLITQGTPSSRATIAAWLKAPPRSTTMPPALMNNDT